VIDGVVTTCRQLKFSSALSQQKPLHLMKLAGSAEAGVAKDAHPTTEAALIVAKQREHEAAELGAFVKKRKKKLDWNVRKIFDGKQLNGPPRCRSEAQSGD
jgi:hypothetical protein